jgi:hypothetical protein
MSRTPWPKMIGLGRSSLARRPLMGIATHKIIETTFWDLHAQR